MNARESLGEKGKMNQRIGSETEEIGFGKRRDKTAASDRFIEE